MDDLEWHDFGLKKASKNSIVYPTLKDTVPKNVIFKTALASNLNLIAGV